MAGLRRIRGMELVRRGGRSGFGRASSFNPLTLSPYVWLDATDLATITKDGSDRVSAWANKGSWGGSYAQGTGANQPLYQASAFSSLPGIYFDGAATAKYLSKAAPAGGIATCTIYAVGHNVGTAYAGENAWVTLGTYGTGNTAFFGVYASTGAAFLCSGNGTVGESSARTITETWTNTTKRLGWRVDPTTNKPIGDPPTVLVDGATITQSYIATAYAGSANIGASSAWAIGSSPNGFWRIDGKLRHVFVFSSSLSNANLLALDAWAATH